MNSDIIYIVALAKINNLKSYFDVNAHLGYKYNSQLTGFLRANNITNNGYQKWLKLPGSKFSNRGGCKL
jgi:outer membrane receptor protein involved in Fe transport